MIQNGIRLGYWSLLLLLLVGVARGEGERTTTVGMAGRIEQLVLPGPELEAVPNDDRKAPVVLRVVRVYPHGTALRYDLEYQGLEPGTFDLRNYLRRKDGSSTADLPPLPVKVVSVLPPGQVLPNPPEIRTAPSLGGYRALQIAAGIAWVLGLVAIVYYGFLRRKSGEVGAAGMAPVSLADRLRPLVGNGLTEVRVRGLWAGIDIDPDLMSGREACELLAERGVLAKETHGSTLRFAPPLVVEAADLDWLVDRLADVLAHPGRGTP